MTRITVYTQADFGKWLKKYHKTETKVELLIHKRHTGKKFPTHNELLREAICWGWVDTILRRIDDDTFIRTFVQRNDNSNWSINTLRYAKELTAQGKMQPHGVHFYMLGKKKKPHDHDLPKNPDMPVELKTALAKNKAAQKHFSAFAPSTRRMLYRWLLRAKRPETKQKRVKHIVGMALANNKTLGATADQNV
jgi:uncharacterized protein YdeI (YjbR/CyaY-like superfamily)